MPASPAKLQELSRLLDQGRHAQVEAEILKLSRLSPGDSNVAALVTRLFAQTGRFDQAVFRSIQHCQRANDLLIAIMFEALAS